MKLCLILTILKFSSGSRFFKWLMRDKDPKTVKNENYKKEFKEKNIREYNILHKGQRQRSEETKRRDEKERDERDEIFKAFLAKQENEIKLLEWERNKLAYKKKEIEKKERQKQEEEKQNELDKFKNKRTFDPKELRTRLHKNEEEKKKQKAKGGFNPEDLRTRLLRLQEEQNRKVEQSSELIYKEQQETLKVYDAIPDKEKINKKFEGGKSNDLKGIPEGRVKREQKGVIEDSKGEETQRKKEMVDYLRRQQEERARNLRRKEEERAKDDERKRQQEEMIRKRDRARTKQLIREQKSRISEETINREYLLKKDREIIEKMSRDKENFEKSLPFNNGWSMSEIERSNERKRTEKQLRRIESYNAR